jgi:hypothetical protein
MTGNKLAGGYQSNSPIKSKRFQRDIPRAQETIYNYLLEIVKEWEPENVLEEFRHLFIHHVNTISSHTLPSLYEIVFANQEQEFRNTLKRSCYILINNWDITRNHKYIQKLIQLFADPILNRTTMSPTMQRLRGWIKAFVQSRDFQELQLFASRYEEKETLHWSQRYASYLLVPQYIDLENPVEQRQAARALSRELKEKFKFELAMYTARSDANGSKDKLPKNPTALGDEVLRLIKAIVAKRGMFSYTNLANIFIHQTQHLNYQDFKQSLQKYLVFSVEQQDYARSLKKQLTEKLDALYVKHHDRVIDDALLLRTCNRIIEYLTTENHQEPSSLFVLLLSHSSPLTLVIILLKLVLICKYSRTHLEARIADLIIYYKDYPEDECKWVVNFFEIFRITMAIYTENIEFNLVNMKPLTGEDQPQAEVEEALSAYRIFSQPKHMPVDYQQGGQGDELDELETEMGDSSAGDA